MTPKQRAKRAKAERLARRAERFARDAVQAVHGDRDTNAENLRKYLEVWGVKPLASPTKATLGRASSVGVTEFANIPVAPERHYKGRSSWHVLPDLGTRPRPNTGSFAGVIPSTDGSATERANYQAVLNQAREQWAQHEDSKHDDCTSIKSGSECETESAETSGERPQQTAERP